MSLRTAIAILALSITTAASAQLQLDPKPEDRNAAIRYGLFWATNGPHAPMEALSRYRPVPRDEKDVDEDLYESIIEWMSEDYTQTILDELCEITAMPYCNFEHPLEQGFSTPVRHLSSLYGWSVKALLFDGGLQAERGERAKAVERTIGILGVANHAAGEELGVTANVSMRFSRYALAMLEVLMEDEPLGGGSAERVLAALERFDSEDPFGVAAWLASGPEHARYGALDLLAATLEVSGGMTAISGLSDGIPLQPQTDEERALVEREMVGVERATADMIEAYQADDLQAVREIGRAIFKGAYGKLARIAMGSLSKLRMDQTKLEDRMEALKTELRVIVEGG